MNKTGWSHKPWVKGGFWGMLILLLQVFIGFIITSIADIFISGPPFSAFELILGYPGAILISPFSISALAAYAGYGAGIFVVPFIIYFVIGAIIGALIHKFRNRRNA